MDRPSDDSPPRGIRNVSNLAAHPAASKKISAVAERVKSKRVDDTSSFSREELLDDLGVSPKILKELDAAGLVKARIVGDVEMYSAIDREIVRVASKFMEFGIDSRHLKGWKHSAEREMGLFEQRINPMLRQRNPTAREQASSALSELITLGELLRAALIAAESRRFADGG